MKVEYLDIIDGTKLHLQIEIDADDLLTEDDMTFLEGDGPDAHEVKLSAEEAIEQMDEERIIELAVKHIKKRVVTFK